MGGRSGSSGMDRGGKSGNKGVIWNTEGTRSFLEQELDKYGLGISKEELANRLYTTASMNGGNVAVLNEKYLTVTGDNGSVNFDFTKSKAEGKWKLTPILKYGDVTKGRHMGYTMYRSMGQWFTTQAEAQWAFVRKTLG